MTAPNETLVRHFCERADAFYKTMQWCAEDFEDRASPYWKAIGLLAVHSAISLSDAVLVATLGKRSLAEDHQKVVRMLESACQDRRRDASGIVHFRRLLSSKSSFAYGEKRITRDDLDRAKLNAERFYAWGYRVFANELKWDNEP